MLKSQLSKNNSSFNQKANRPNKSQNVSVDQSKPIDDSHITFFIIDSGTTQHMCCSKENMINYKVVDNPVSVQIGDGRVLKGVGTRCINIKTPLPGNKIKHICLEDVLHVPKLPSNLISVAKASANGRKVVFTDEACRIYSMSNTLIAVGKNVNELHFLECDVNFAYTSRPSVTNNSYLWHQRFCHLGYANMRKLASQDMVRRLKCEFSCNFDFL